MTHMPQHDHSIEADEPSQLQWNVQGAGGKKAIGQKKKDAAAKKSPQKGKK